MDDVTRRDALKMLVGAGAVVGCSRSDKAAAEGEPAATAEAPEAPIEQAPAEDPEAVLEVVELGFPWATRDPFLFCAHHLDHYPEGTERFGPAPKHLKGRSLGRDFEIRDGFRMYHGDVVPGFPQHPHRGFETVTVVRKGRLDHADSMGAKARYGGGDAQWLTAGKGILHAEMFPLLHADRPNTLELFQIWLNLPAAEKMVDPYFTMLWDETIPEHVVADAEGRETRVTTIAGRYGERPGAPSPPPDSWASKPGADVAIWTVDMGGGAHWTLPPTKADTNRSLYFFAGSGLKVAGRDIEPYRRVDVVPDRGVRLVAGSEPAQILLLQGKPIGEPVAKHGPFVMNSRDEIQQAFRDYRRTRFGGWPWDRDDPVHGGDPARFARHADGRLDKPS